MSLINQVLQDLDARQTVYGGGTRLANDVRPLPVVRASRLPVYLGIVGLAALVGGFAFFQWGAWQEVVPNAQPVSQPAVVLQASGSGNVTPPEAQPVEQTPLALKGLEGSLRMTDAIQPLPQKKPVVKNETKPATVPTGSQKTETTGKTTVVESNVTDTADKLPPSLPVTLPQQTGKTVTPSLIEKTDAVGSPRERAEAEYRKAIAAVNQGRVIEALEGLRNALRQDGFHVASRQLLVKLLLEARRSDEAVQALQDGLQGQPQQVGWAMSLARLQVDRGDFPGAWQTLNYSLPAATGNADYQGFAAHVLQRLGRNKEAAGYYLAAARLSPGDGRWWLGLGLTMEAEGRHGEAKEAFLRARQSGHLGTELITLIEQKLR